VKRDSMAEDRRAVCLYLVLSVLLLLVLLQQRDDLIHRQLWVLSLQRMQKCLLLLDLHQLVLRTMRLIEPSSSSSSSSCSSSATWPLPLALTAAAASSRCCFAFVEAEVETSPAQIVTDSFTAILAAVAPPNDRKDATAVAPTSEVRIFLRAAAAATASSSSSLRSSSSSSSFF
jgi:hypothetical protein